MQGALFTSALAASVLTAILIAITIVDMRRLVIPDALNIALACSGLVFRAVDQPHEIWTQVLSATTVFLTIAVVRKLHTALTGRVGLGFGDVKMLAAAACWISPLLFPIFLFLASATALVFVGARVIAAGPSVAKARTPFGPFIACGLALTWAFEQISPFY